MRSRASPVISGSSSPGRRAGGSSVRKERALTLLSIDPHAPAEFRATEPVKNIDAFHLAFGTAEGDGMYLPPEDRVTIW